MRAAVALAGVAAVAASTLAAAGPAAAINRTVPVSPAPYVWSDTYKYSTAQVEAVAGDVTELEIVLPSASKPAAFTEWSHPAYETIGWEIQDGDGILLSGESTLDATTNSITLALDQPLGSFDLPGAKISLVDAVSPATDAVTPQGAATNTGFILDIDTFVSVAAPGTGADGVIDLSTSAPASKINGGIFWAGGGRLSTVATGDALVLESGVAGFFDLQGVGAKVGIGANPDITAPFTVDSDASAITVTPPQSFYDRYAGQGGTTPDAGPSVVITGVSKGDEQPAGSVVRVKAPLTVDGTPVTPPPAAGPTVTRLAGTDRQGTAVEVSKSIFKPNVPVVYIATGSNFPDALSAGPAAAKQGGPLLLVDADSVSKVVTDELTRLAPKNIVVVGSALSVSDRLLGQLSAYAPAGKTVRVGGVDRYDTSRQLIQRVFGSSGSSDAWLATGEKFPDALSASAAAGSSDAPVILVNGGLPTADATTQRIVSGLRVADLTIAGSPLSVSTGIENSLVGPAKTRIGGTDRYDTSEQLNRAAFKNAPTAFFATGEKFPDALAGAAAAGYANAPLFAVRPDCVPRAVLTDLKNAGTTRVVLLGGEGTLSEAVEQLTPCA
ncbi:cell wall-binding repeat-containing protein [Rathayibacter sp. VKM Ac-2630]|uniref:cell wall-binding repeat-containing protein n=1 Tax=Rathayibacter sp. VKM Ac-2630 TaxID=1938617 RepID=UPI0011158E1A|nr:cell wall-binding repeat-containing protein [Rathayibacter sp. VKM Ac-2630]